MSHLTILAPPSADPAERRHRRASARFGIRLARRGLIRAMRHLDKSGDGAAHRSVGLAVALLDDAAAALEKS